MSTALAFKYEELAEDLSPVEALTIGCPRCDPDSPIASTRKDCPLCKGTGRSPLAVAGIVEEIKAARLEALHGPSKSSDLDEYVDEDDSFAE
jgi:hypothetical protein